MGWIVTAKDLNGDLYTLTHAQRYLSDVVAAYNSGAVSEDYGSPLTFVDAVSDKDHHVCKYCKGIAKGPDEDVLCEECREMFGHALYSEL